MYKIYRWLYFGWVRYYRWACWNCSIKSFCAGWRKIPSDLIKLKCLEQGKCGPLGLACCFWETIMWKRFHQLVQPGVLTRLVQLGEFLHRGCLSATRLSEDRMLCVSQVARLSAGRHWQTGWWRTENRPITTGSPVPCNTSAGQTLPWVSI